MCFMLRLPFWDRGSWVGTVKGNAQENASQVDTGTNSRRSSKVTGLDGRVTSLQHARQRSIRHARGIGLLRRAHTREISMMKWKRSARKSHHYMRRKALHHVARARYRCHREQLACRVAAVQQKACITVRTQGGFQGAVRADSPPKLSACGLSCHLTRLRCDCTDRPFYYRNLSCP